MKVLVFDTETTGLPEEKNASIKDTKKWPYIIQLSYILYDSDKQEILSCVDDIIRISDEVTITPKSIQMHGITRSISKLRGISIQDAINNFNDHVNMCDMIVGHNIAFDKKMIMVESNRVNNRQYFNKKMEFCTMKKCVKMCDIKTKNKNGETYLKYPTLSELHQKLFGEVPSGTHNSLVDVLVCIRCFNYIDKHKDISVSGCNNFQNIYYTYFNN